MCALNVTPTVAVLGEFSLVVNGVRLELTAAVERLLAFLVVEGGTPRRRRVAAALWPEKAERRAAANLRTVLWRLSKASDDAVVTWQGERISLQPSVEVDLYECRERVASMRAGGEVTDRTLDLLRADLLPDCYEDWCVLEQERHRHFRIRTLEDVCRRATNEAHYELAVEAGTIAVSCEPLRGSARRTLIAAHLSEGNVAEACRQLDAYRDALRHAGLTSVPTDDLNELVRESLTRARQRTLWDR
jgi:DNA-binding SARP family transcriptional activator